MVRPDKAHIGVLPAAIDLAGGRAAVAAAMYSVTTGNNTTIVVEGELTLPCESRGSTDDKRHAIGWHMIAENGGCMQLCIATIQGYLLSNGLRSALCIISLFKLVQCVSATQGHALINDRSTSNG